MYARSAQEMEDWIITMELVLKCEGVCVCGGGGGKCGGEMCEGGFWT